VIAAQRAADQISNIWHTVGAAAARVSYNGAIGRLRGGGCA
jgi:hypothetical protein